MAFTQHFVTFRMQTTRKLFQKVRLNLTFLWLFISLFVFNFVFFEACLKLIPLFQRYMDMYPRVLYTKSNLSLCLFNMWNMSLICQPMPEIRGVSKNKWTLEHPVAVEGLLNFLHNAPSSGRCDKLTNPSGCDRRERTDRSVLNGQSVLFYHNHSGRC